jgi:hypothetical protein
VLVARLDHRSAETEDESLPIRRSQFALNRETPKGAVEMSRGGAVVEPSCPLQ